VLLRCFSQECKEVNGSAGRRATLTESAFQTRFSTGSHLAAELVREGFLRVLEEAFLFLL